MIGKGSLLIVEDDQVIQELLKYFLGPEGEGYSITAAASVEEASAALENENFQLGILDGEFPGGGGACVNKILRLRYPRIKVLSFAGELQDYGDTNLQKCNVSEVVQAVVGLLSQE